uniref:(northern house mosquito) hypothetical protein n=2 Tax=Culex pipiens TaxID=7175 RepID=A0A8D8IXY2_CULPI
MELFNICSADRKIREVVAAEPTILGLKKAAFQLLKKPILALVMEASGFKVSNDQVLKLIKHNIVMVLTLNEIWTEAEVEHSTLGCVQQQQQTKTEARVTEQSDNEELVDVIVPDEEFDETDENENLSLQNTSELQAKHTPAKNISIELQHLAEVTPSTSNKESQPCEQFGDEDLDVTTNVNESAPLLNAPELNDQTSEQSPLLGDVSPSSNQSTKGSASGQQLEQEPCTSGKSPKRSQQQAVKVSTKRVSITMKFENFEINWAKLDDAVYERLKNKNESSDQRVSKQDRIKVVNMTIDQLRVIDTQVSACVIETAAKQILQKFKCFQSADDDGCQDQNRGWSTLKTYMINRNSFLNRPQDINKTPPTSKNTKHLRNMRSGTFASYWNESNASCDKTTTSKLKRDDINILTENFLESCVGFIRHILDQKKPLVEIVNEWPVVRRRQIIEYHFQQATGVNIQNLSAHFKAKRPKIIQFSQQNQKSELDENSNDYQILTFLCNYLKEKFDDICCKKELGTKLNEISLSPGPGLIAVDLGSSQCAYYVFADSARLSEGASTILIALQDLFGILYINNFMYPKGNSKFLEFIQQYFLKIIPAYGSKSKATRVGKQQRVVNRLISELSSINNIAEQ